MLRIISSRHFQMLIELNFSLVSSDSDQTLFQILRSKTMNENAERINGWAAMLGVIAAMGSYATTGQLIPGIW